MNEQITITPEIHETLKVILKYENKEGKKKNYLGFKWIDIAVKPQILHKLLYAGLLKKGYYSSKHKFFRIKSKVGIKKLIRQYEDDQKRQKIKEPLEMIPKIRIPEDLFKPIVGYDDIKKLFLTSIKSKEPVHVLLQGPPASAKTVFLLEVARLIGSYYALGGYSSKVGLVEQLVALKPKYLLIDEFEKMDKKDMTVLLGLCENGLIKADIHGKHIELRLKTRVYAACNNFSKVPPEILSRFMKLKLQKYYRKDFVKIATQVLKIREGIGIKLSSFIAEKLADLEVYDVRDAVRIARLSKDENQVNDWIDLLIKYG